MHHVVKNYNEEDLKLMSAIAAHVATAVENALNFEEARNQLHTEITYLHDAEHRRGGGHLISGDHADPYGTTAYRLSGIQYLSNLPFGDAIGGWAEGSVCGFRTGLADQQAYATLFGMIERQAAMGASVRVFQYLAVMVLVLIPIIALRERPHKGQSSQPMAH